VNAKNIALINNISNSTNTLPDEQQQQLIQLVKQLDSPQSLWLSGYLAAQAEFQSLGSNQKPTSESNTSNALSTSQGHKLTILYGSQTGNGAVVAEHFEQQAQSAGIDTELFSLADFTVKQLTKKTIITVIVSTHGEGEAPDDAELFHEQLFSAKAPDLTHLKYSVLALGDSSYEWFCQTGQEIDQQLAELGAKQIYPRVDCDVDYEADSTQWIKKLIPAIETLIETDNATDNITALPLQARPTEPTTTPVNKYHPYHAEILTIQKITGRGSSKNTYHVELAIDPDLIRYQPGDSVGVIAKNNLNTVHQLLTYWQQTGTESFIFKDQSMRLETLLLEHIEITQISKPFIQFLAKQINDQALNVIAASHEAFENYCQNHQLLDLLQTFDPQNQVPIQVVLNQLKSITPRLYSIASAQSDVEDEVHLTINLEPATPAGHHGLASGLLCELAAVGDEVPIYIEPNNKFRLPEDTTTPIIMIGPGTGVAPYRAFMQERHATAATGENWLFFGNPNFATDFLYQTEWLKLQQSGLLKQIDVAFSRDQTAKIYVQDKLKDHAAKIWQWLEQGAHIYICGNAKHMAKDVEQTLNSIIIEHGQLPQLAAKDYLKTLKRNNRYQKDVY
jgi:sulfite reductase (NADPH) flavoprotein alpha-component